MDGPDSTYVPMTDVLRVCVCVCMHESYEYQPLINSMCTCVGHKSLLPLFAGGMICLTGTVPLGEAQVSPMGRFSTISL